MLLFLCLGVCTNAQTMGQEVGLTDSARMLDCLNHVLYFNQYYPQEKVYLHLDNTGYFKGETIWFKAYVVRCDTEQRTDLSHVLYVELLNPSGDVVEKRKLPIENGEAHGDIKVDSILTTGFYEIRAYTRYMTNWGTNACFSRVIPIFKAPKTEGDYSDPKIDIYSYRKRMPDVRTDENDNEQEQVSVFERLKHAPKVTFYPEGGELVAGHKTRMAYSINYGDSIDRGITEITPDPDMTEYEFIDRKGKRRKAQLPLILESGATMRLNTLDNDEVTVEVETTDDLRGTLMGCVLMHKGDIIAVDTFRMEGRWRKNYNRSTLPAGVSQITVFGGNGMRLAERLFFICPREKQGKEVEVNVKSTVFRPCGKIEMELHAVPNASLSFSAVDAATVTGGKEGNVHTWMLLSSELKGYIEHPEYYFEADDREHREAADLLTMVQGWRRYNWDLMTGLIEWEKFEPIENQLYLHGHLRSKKKKLPVENVDITAYMYNRKGENMKASFTTGEDGKYYFTLPEINGEWNLQLLSKYDDKAQDYFIGIDRNFSPDGRWLSPYETRQVEVDTGKVYRSALMEIDETPILMTKQNHVLKNVTVKAKRLIGDVNTAKWFDETDARRHANLYYDADADVDMFQDKGEMVPTVGAWLKMKNSLFDGEENPRFKMIKLKDSLDTPLSDIEEDILISRGNILYRDGLTYRGKPIVWIVDNSFCTITRFTKKHLQVFNDDCLGALVSMPTFIDEIKSVYITDDSNFLNYYIQSDQIDALQPAIVFVYTHPKYYFKQKGLRRTHFEGYSQCETFQMEDYSKIPPMEDFRRTLYWQPDLRTDSEGKAKVEFYNNSSCREMFISVEGMTQDGKFLSNE